MSRFNAQAASRRRKSNSHYKVVSQQIAIANKRKRKQLEDGADFYKDLIPTTEAKYTGIKEGI